MTMNINFSVSLSESNQEIQVCMMYYKNISDSEKSGFYRLKRRQLSVWLHVLSPVGETRWGLLHHSRFIHDTFKASHWLIELHGVGLFLYVYILYNLNSVEVGYYVRLSLIIPFNLPKVTEIDWYKNHTLASVRPLSKRKQQTKCILKMW